MPTPLQPRRPSAPAEDTDDPVVLWEAVVQARLALAQQRRHAANSNAHGSARHAFLRALEAYAASIAERRRPLPYALRDELRLLRLTCSAERD